MTPAERQAILRAALLVQPESKEALHRWIEVYLGLDIPDGHIDPDSNSSPMDMIWEVYSRMRARDETLSRMLVYAARESFKTLGAAVLEMIVLLLLERDVGHMASILFQAKNAQKYVKQFAKRPFVRDFVTTDNETSMEITRFKAGSRVISPKEYAALPDTEKVQYSESTNRMTILVATMNQTNSLHVPFFVEDELDLAPPGPLEEAKMIPTQGRDGEPSVTLMVSTRKFSFGPVQKELDNAAKSGLEVRHWNIIDVTRPCTDDRARPNEGTQTVYTSDEDFITITKSDYEVLPEEQRPRYVERTAFAGCTSRCKLFTACKGRLHTLQKSQSPLNKRITETQTKMSAVDVDRAQAQLMCWKPSQEGMIYPRFDPKKHCLSPAEMYEKLTGDRAPMGFGKSNLIEVMKQRGMTFYAGIDHGFTHYYAVVISAVEGGRMFVVDVIAGQQWELADKIDHTKERFTVLGIDPVIYADPEDPGSNKTLGRHFRVRKWDKGPNSVIEGIQIVRLKLTPTLRQDPELFFLKGSDEMEILFDQVKRYHWKIDPTTELPTKDPDKVDDDLADAMRYLVMNVFARKGKLVVAEGTINPNVSGPFVPTPQPTQQNWMTQQIQQLTGGNSTPSDSGTGGIKVHKGSFFFGC